MDGMYRSTRGPIWAVHTDLSICPTIPCVGTKVRCTSLFRHTEFILIPYGYRYADRRLPGDTTKIDRRQSILAVNDRLREKKGRRRRRKKEEEKKKEYLAPSSPAHCRRPRS
ncbi:hypothetical protein B296_00048780 [Ensete ventricosum]|uniref:Uncharacterized protein n=1 Tax=Ensete ventricosum TaxID=4639 RepID=A0A426YT92_ENSVE|nr:hypothetical protein B296_00048780 [Ensete ventricosum]